MLAASRLPGRWSRRLVVAVVVISAVSLATQVLRYGFDVDPPGLNSLERWFFVDREMGVPAWFSAVLLFAIGERLWQVGTAVRATDGRWYPQWRLLAIVFVYLSLDELTEIHEQTIRPLKDLFQLSGVLGFAWVVVAVPLVLVLGALLLPFLRALPSSTRWAFVLSAACYLGGAVGLEMVGAVLFQDLGVPVVTTTEVGGVSTVTEDVHLGGMLYAVVVGAEEALEMLGLVLFLGAVSTTLRRTLLTAVPAAHPEELLTPSA